MAKPGTPAEGASSELRIRRLSPGDKFSGFSLGHENFTPLKTFARRHSHKYEQYSLSRTYVAEDGSKLVGYVTVVCGEVAVENGRPRLIENDVNYNYSSYPALKIARLAVDEKYRRLKIGQNLVQFSLGMATVYICPWAGCRFAMVDSKRESIQFYEKCGFTKLDTRENNERDEPVMFIDLMKSAAPQAPMTTEPDASRT